MIRKICPPPRPFLYAPMTGRCAKLSGRFLLCRRDKPVVPYVCAFRFDNSRVRLGGITAVMTSLTSLFRLDCLISIIYLICAQYPRRSPAEIFSVISGDTCKRQNRPLNDVMY